MNDLCLAVQREMERSKRGSRKQSKETERTYKSYCYLQARIV